MRRLAQFVRLSASRVSRLASACICLACVSRLSASASVSPLRAFVSRASRVCLRLFTSRVPNASASASVSHLSRVCLASASVSHLSASVVLSRVCLSPCECLRELAHFMRRSSFKEFKRFFAIDLLVVHIDYVDYMNRPLIF